MPNPYSSALIGFIIGAGPLGCALMGWRGAGGEGVATIGVSYFFGGMLQLIGAIMEWIVGNTFPFVCFGTFGKCFGIRERGNMLTRLYRCLLLGLCCYTGSSIRC